MRQTFERVGLPAAAAIVGLLLGLGEASAQTAGCADPMSTCAGALSRECLNAGRLGAGVLPAQAAGCADQLAQYRACLSDFVERCGDRAASGQGAASCDAETARVLWEDVKAADDCLAYQGYREACPDTPQARIAANRLTRLNCGGAALQRADAAGAPVRRLGGHEGAVTAANFVDARRALSASADRSLKLWNLETGAEIRTMTSHRGGVSDVAVSPDGRTALSAGEDSALILWSLERGEATLLGRHSGPVQSVAFTPDGAQALSISSGSGEGLKLWDLGARRERLVLDQIFALSSKIAISPDGTLAIGASHDDERALRIFSLKRKSVLRTLDPGSATITAVAFSPDGRMIMVGRKNGVATFHETKRVDLARPAAGARSRAVTSVAFGPTGALAIAGSEDGSATVWDAADGRELQVLETGDAAVTSVAFAPDGRAALIGAQDGALALWRLEAD